MIVLTMQLTESPRPGSEYEVVKTEYGYSVISRRWGSPKSMGLFRTKREAQALADKLARERFVGVVVSNDVTPRQDVTVVQSFEVSGGHIIRKGDPVMSNEHGQAVPMKGKR